MFRMFASNSIKFRIMGIFFLIILMMMLSFWISLSRQNVNTNEYQRFMDNNTLLSELPLLINEASREFSQYFNNREDENLNQFNQTNTDISNTLLAIEHAIVDDKNSSIFYRTLNNMHEYQLMLSYRLFTTDQLNLSIYQDLTYLKNLYDYMNEQSQQLSIAYLEYSGTKYGQLLNNSKNVERNMYIIIGLFGVVSIVFAIILSNGIFKKMAEISRVAKRVSHQADWDTPDISPSKYIELDNVATAFNRMKVSMIHYISELKEKAKIENQLNDQRLRNLETDKMLKESQFLSLQMQMNPHFLFNTLNMIGRTALLKKYRSTVELIEAISEILRYNLENGGNAVSLTDEVRSLKSYLYIQEMRFQDRMSFHLKIHGEIDEVSIPPMILQPIVENSIIHGLKNTNQNGIVGIVIQREHSLVQIKISDNGIGMNEEQIKQILQGRSGKKTSIGLSNVKERLEIFYGMKHLIAVESFPELGTTVLLHIPLQGGEHDDSINDRRR